MSDLQNLSLKVKNYKSFGDDPQGFERILPINLIIGKNNSGKSALLDAVGYAAVKQDSIMPNLHNKGNAPELIIKKDLTEVEIRSTFQESYGGGHIGGNHYQYGQKWIGKPITLSFPFTGKQGSLASIEPEFDKVEIRNEHGAALANRIENPFNDYVPRRIAADRDIKPETAEEGHNLSSDGTGATNLIRFCLHDADANASSFIKKDLLGALNFVFEGETVFSDLLVKSRNNTWEVYLVEDIKGGNEIPLSNSGSGLKTIIHVLLELLVMSRFIANHGEDHFIFMFEEIENNLHPGLLRNLLSFIRSYAEDKGCTFFITTHSSVTIDLFDRDSNAQILHVTHDKSSSRVTTVSQWQDKKGVIDDLDVRSSDILQANAVIWVEGPSDRTYINHWIDLHSKGQLREGEHYQCVFYGGKLLSRLSADPDNKEEINILRVNSNAILIMDSDTTVPDAQINQTKKRMKKEVEDVKGYVWVTDGKEIENYLPKELLEGYYQKTTDKHFGKTTKIQDFLNRLEAKLGDTFIRQKPLFAERFVGLYTSEMLEKDDNLKQHLNKVCVQLRKWNGLQDPKEVIPDS